MSSRVPMTVGLSRPPKSTRSSTLTFADDGREMWRMREVDRWHDGGDWVDETIRKVTYTPSKAATARVASTAIAEDGSDGGEKDSDYEPELELDESEVEDQNEAGGSSMGMPVIEELSLEIDVDESVREAEEEAACEYEADGHDADESYDDDDSSHGVMSGGDGSEGYYDDDDSEFDDVDDDWYDDIDI